MSKNMSENELWKWIFVPPGNAARPSIHAPTDMSGIDMFAA